MSHKQIENSVYQVNYEHFGTITLSPLKIERDIALIHDWVNRPYAFFWGLQQTSLETVKQEYEKLLVPEHYDVFMGYYNGKPAFLLERYDPAKDLIADYYSVQEGDCGIHILVAPADQPIPNFTWYVFRAICSFVFENPQVQRILVEPDIQNKKMFAICERIGFVLNRIITLPHKTAQLAFYQRKNFVIHQQNKHIIKRSAMNTINNNIVSPQQAIAHIQPQTWATANRLLVRKALAEFSHELLLQPELQNASEGWNSYVVRTDDQQIEYRFKAKEMALNHWYIQLSSIEKFKGDEALPLDALLLIKEFKTTLGIAHQAMPIYLEEITSTLYGSAYKLIKGNPTAKELVKADFQTIEQAMTEGHPGFVANNGRIGFDSGDYRAYAPESGNSFSILWLAGHKDRTFYAGTKALDYNTLIAQELDETTRTRFAKIIRDDGFVPEDYYFIPVQPPP